MDLSILIALLGLGLALPAAILATLQILDRHQNHKANSSPPLTTGDTNLTSLSSGRTSNILLDKGQTVAMLFGIAIYGGLRWFFLRANGPIFFTLSLPLSTSELNTLDFGFMEILFGLTLCIPFFLSIKFGPWIGLVVALAGDVLAFNLFGRPFAGSFVSLPYFVFVNGYFMGAGFVSVEFSWQWYTASAICGFLPGLTLLLTKKQSARKRTMGIAIIMCAIAIIMGSLLISYSFKAQFNILPFFTVLLFQMLANSTALIALPILLLIYDAIVKRRSH
ncbi:hypothetical protein KSF_049530 [Reticulibacter mediterranei]|uniref:ECF transporter S component n=1 Tax=Reticulibacter mediterranei TaxID=2778369 RepID=A0A8J3IQB1_9CHLR|nr:hypothetical protein [Reticulibacter mediterranei]GHO94905.1 hypothetical protein KSF_049530 [Reticulibacter mediterranei]